MAKRKKTWVDDMTECPFCSKPDNKPLPLLVYHVKGNCDNPENPINAKKSKKAK